MSDLNVSPDREEYRLALILSSSGHVLVQTAEGPPQLPRLLVPASARPAAVITEAIKTRWRLPAVLIDTVVESPRAPLAIARAWTSKSSQGDASSLHLKARFTDLGLDQLSNEEQATLRQVLDEDAGERGPLSRLGWIDEAARWLSSALQRNNLAFVVQQHNAGGRFALVRFEAEDGSAYWLKAVGPPNDKEFHITSYLAERLPTFLPEIIASRGDWTAWLMKEHGRSMHESTDPKEFEQVSRRLAQMQLHLLGKTDQLLDVGCTDHRTSTLRNAIDQIVSSLAFAMERQTVRTVPCLPTSRLEEIGTILRIACDNLDGLHIPDSLLHNDISPGSVLKSGDHFVFTDWCEAYVGNPFLTFALFCFYLRNSIASAEAFIPRIASAYNKSWIGLFAEHDIEVASALAPPLSILSHICGRGTWLRDYQQCRPEVLSYYRSLARHLDRSVRAPEFEAVL